MSNSSILGGERAAAHAKGKDVDALGPSDSSDSGSDVQGETVMSTDADSPDELGAMPVGGGTDSGAFGTGERGSATGRDGPDNADIMPTRIEGLGGEEEDALLDADRLDDTDIEALSTDEDDADAESEEALVDDTRPRRESRR